jgi:hypothetical protein
VIYLNKNSDEILIINWESPFFVHIQAKDVHGIMIITEWEATKKHYELIGEL